MENNKTALSIFDIDLYFAIKAPKIFETFSNIHTKSKSESVHNVEIIIKNNEQIFNTQLGTF